jgi:hypothetical protein
MADIYLVSPTELCTHLGVRAERLHQLDLEPTAADIARLALATGACVDVLLRLTFRDAPPRLRSLVHADSRDICPACADEARPGRTPRLKEWAFAFTLWCPKHRCRLHGADMSGLDTLGNEQLARRGAKILNGWARGGPPTTPPVPAAIKLLLMPYRAPSPPAPWELARISPSAIRKRHQELIRPRPRKALSRVVPEYDRAIAIHEQRLPEKAPGLRDARAAERHAVAIGIARMIADPVHAAVQVLLACDDLGRPRIEACLSAWPPRLRNAISRALLAIRRRQDRGRSRVPTGSNMERN